MPATPNAEHAVSLAPLTSFYNRAGQAFPKVSFIHGEAMPEPYRHLLVHHSDMTPRLKAFHGSEITLEVLALETQEPSLTREVLLRRQDNLKPVEFGAIQIYLDKLPERIAKPVRAAIEPLGGILEKERFRHLSAPRGYFQAEADNLMVELLDAELGQTLYGRCNVLALKDGTVFAEIVEILPPQPSET